MLTDPVSLIAHEVTVTHPFPLFFSRYSVPVVAIVDFFGSIDADAEIFFPEIAMCEVAINVFSHRGVIVSCDATSTVFPAANTVATLTIIKRVVINANVTLFVFLIKNPPCASLVSPI